MVEEGRKLEGSTHRGRQGIYRRQGSRKWGNQTGERGGRNRFKALGRRSREGPGEYVEGDKTSSAETGIGGRQYWMLIQVDKLSINQREGRESGAKRAVQLIIRVLNGGGGKDTEGDRKISL